MQTERQAKRAFPLVDNRYAAIEETIVKSDPISSLDESEWEYMSTIIQNEDTELPAGVKGGNWGNKLYEGARWLRRGKLAAWSPTRDDWEVVTDFAGQLHIYSRAVCSG